MNTSTHPVGPIFTRFLRFGCQAWGGPFVQIAALRREYAERDRWVTPERFDRALAVYQALPGPEAHEMCVYLGMVRGGRAGGIAAGLGFMLPGFLLMLMLAWAYARFGMHPAAAAALAMAQSAVAALIVRAAYTLARRVLVDTPRRVIGVAALLAGFAGAPMLLVLVCGGAALATARIAERFRALLAILVVVTIVFAWLLVVVPWINHQGIGATPPVAASTTDPAAIAANGAPSRTPPAPPTPADLARTGLRAGLLSFGGAYTALPFLRRDAVIDRGWMSESAFLDGVTLAGVLPAPLIIVGTFVGAQGGGLAGALIVTLTIFLPAFAFTLIGHQVFEAMLDRPRLHAFLDGVTAAVVGLIGAVAIQLTVAALAPLFHTLAWSAIRPVAVVVFVAALVVLWQVRRAWITPGVLAAASLLGLALWAIDARSLATVPISP